MFTFPKFSMINGGLLYNKRGLKYLDLADSIVMAHDIVNGISKRQSKRFNKAWKNGNIYADPSLWIRGACYSNMNMVIRPENNIGDIAVVNHEFGHMFFPSHFEAEHFSDEVYGCAMECVTEMKLKEMKIKTSPETFVRAMFCYHYGNVISQINSKQLLSDNTHCRAKNFVGNAIGIDLAERIAGKDLTLEKVLKMGPDISAEKLARIGVNEKTIAESSVRFVKQNLALCQ